MRDDTESRLDDAIDNVARSLIAGDPDLALREAVRARVERPAAGRRLWLYAATASAALIVVALTWVASNRQPVPEVSTPMAAVTEATPLAAPAVEVFPGSSIDVGRASGPPVARIPVPAALAVAALTEAPLQIDLLDVVPLDVEPLEIPQIAVDAIGVEPLAMQ